MSEKKKGAGLKAFLIILILCAACAVGFLVVRYLSVKNEVDRLTPFETECVGLTEQVNTLNEEKAAQADQIDTLTGEKAAQAEQIGTLTAENADQAARIVTLTAQVDTLTAENAELSQNVNSYILWQADLTSMVDGQAAVNSRLVKENAELAAQVDDSTALAAVEEGTFAATKRCILMLQQNGIAYIVNPAADETGTDQVSVVLKAESDSGTAFTYTMTIGLTEKNDNAALRVDRVVSFAQDNLAAVQEACLKANAGWRYVTLVPDTARACVMAQMDVILPANASAGDVLWQAMCAFNTVMAGEYDDLIVLRPNILMLEPVTATVTDL